MKFVPIERLYKEICPRCMTEKRKCECSLWGKIKKAIRAMWELLK